MPEEGSPSQMDPCQHLRDRIQQLGQEILELHELVDSGEAPPSEVERFRAEIRRREADRSRTVRELDECEQEARKEAAKVTFGQPTFQSDETSSLTFLMTKGPCRLVSPIFRSPWEAVNHRHRRQHARFFSSCHSKASTTRGWKSSSFAATRLF